MFSKHVSVFKSFQQKLNKTKRNKNKQKQKQYQTSPKLSINSSLVFFFCLIYIFQVLFSWMFLNQKPCLKNMF